MREFTWNDDQSHNSFIGFSVEHGKSLQEISNGFKGQCVVQPGVYFMSWLAHSVTLAHEPSSIPKPSLLFTDGVCGDYPYNHSMNHVTDLVWHNSHMHYTTNPWLHFLYSLGWIMASHGQPVFQNGRNYVTRNQGNHRQQLMRKALRRTGFIDRLLLSVCSTGALAIKTSRLSIWKNG